MIVAEGGGGSGMRVLVAPDRYAGTLTAGEAAEAIRAGWLATAPYDEMELLPLSDGGPGFLDVLAAALGGDIGVVTVRGPPGDPVAARLLVRTENGHARRTSSPPRRAGCTSSRRTARDPVRATSYGVGELLLAAMDRGCDRVVVGVGGTATPTAGRACSPRSARTPATSWPWVAQHWRESAGSTWRRHVERVLGVTLVAATDVGDPLMGPPAPRTASRRARARTGPTASCSRRRCA